MSEFRGSRQEELPHARGQGWLHGCRRAKRSNSTLKVRRGGREEILLVQGKEQQLCFAGAAMKRYPTSKVRETRKTVGVARGHQKADRLKP